MKRIKIYHQIKKLFALSKNEEGVALILVLTSVALLSLLLVDFTFETTINKLKVYNGEDKLQARLNAEAGLNFSLAKLRVYQEGINLLEKNKSIKEQLKPSMVESLMTQPFIYPIPIGSEANIIQKNAVAEFAKTSLVKGEMSVTIAAVSGFLNPNNLRIKANPNANSKQNNAGEPSGQNEKSPHAYIEEKLVETLTKAIENKREKDIEFDRTYPNLNPELLIKELKFYVTPANEFEDAERAEIEALYLAKDIIPKHQPMTSLSELYSLVGWPDIVVDLIKDKLTVHEVSIIQVNEITEQQLKIIFPNITEIQVEEFFKHRDGDVDLNEPPKEFTSENDFKALVTGSLGILSEGEYTERMKELEIAGLKIGVAGKLFRVTSIGRYNKATLTLNALIDLPVKPKPLPTPKNNNNNEINSENNGNQTTTTNNTANNNSQETQPKEQPFELMAPRIIEISTK